MKLVHAEEEFEKCSETVVDSQLQRLLEGKVFATIVEARNAMDQYHRQKIKNKRNFASRLAVRLWWTRSSSAF